MKLRKSENIISNGPCSVECGRKMNELQQGSGKLNE